MRRGQEQIRHQIISAARGRFLKAGYGKTTMSELAEDCDISPAHLYNFFAGKLDLAVAITEEESRYRRAELAKILADDKSAQDILPAYFARELTLNVEALEAHPGMQGLIDLVRRKRPLVAEGLHRRLLKDLSLYLNKRIGVKDVKSGDPFHLAEYLHQATYAFRQPGFLSSRSAEELLALNAGILELLLSGIQKK